MKMVLNKTEKIEMKKIQSRFFHSNVLAKQGSYLTKEEVDELRAEVTKTFKSKKFKRLF